VAVRKKMNKKIAIQGIAASFHEVAALTYFDEPIESVECLTFHALCEALKNGKADFAVMAIENSIAGSILPNYFLLQEYHFSIMGELYLPIHMHLLALHGTTLKDIRCIESHPMAIRQCSDYIHRLNGIEVRESDDTALSAKRIKEKKHSREAHRNTQEELYPLSGSCQEKQSVIREQQSVAEL
jgi:prephenate dehydratase